VSGGGNSPSTPAERVGFATDIRQLFRESDRAAMLSAFDLWAYHDVVTHGAAIAAKLHDGSMPCDGPWPADRVALFERWRAEGAPE
jgi:hypothetical protein